MQKMQRRQEPATPKGVGLFGRNSFTWTGVPPGERGTVRGVQQSGEGDADPVIIRTLDIGGDKDIPYMKMDREDNPFMGFRAVRYCLENRELLETQLRALLRANAEGNMGS